MSGIFTGIQKWISRIQRDEIVQDVEGIDPDPIVQCSAREMLDLLDSRAWKDIEASLKVKILGYRDALEITPLHNDIIHVQGEIYALRTALAIPHIILETLERKEMEKDADASDNQ